MGYHKRSGDGQNSGDDFGGKVLLVVFWSALLPMIIIFKLVAFFVGEKIAWRIFVIIAMVLMILTTLEYFSEKESAHQRQSEMSDSQKRIVEAEMKIAKVRFTFSDSTVLDKQTKLMWTKTGNIAGSTMSLNDVHQVVQQLNEQKYAGYSNWRLPSKEELETLVNYAKGEGYNGDLNKLLNKRGFKDVQSDYYWSSTTDASYSPDRWIISMGGGGINGGYKTGSYYVLPVRDEQ